MKSRLQRAFNRVARKRDKELDEFGRELNTGIPMAPPVGYTPQKSMIEIVREQIRSEHLRLSALQANMETFEEADDFAVDDDYDPSTPYEEVFDPVDYEVRDRLRQAEFHASVESRLNEARSKEKADGSQSDERRDKGSNRRAGISGAVDESNASANAQSDDGRSDGEVSERPSPVKGKDRK